MKCCTGMTADTIKESIKKRGNLYVHNKDRDGKSLLVFSVKNHKRGEEAIDDMKRTFLYYLERQGPLYFGTLIFH